MSTDTITTQDIFSELFANQTICPSSWLSVVFAVAVAFALGLFIYWVYRTNYRGVMYSSNFGMTLVMMTLVTTPVVMCIKSSIQLSMGMVGALSIVRFRTAVKDPLDTAYMFWALTMGILLGAGQFFLAVLSSVCIAILAFATSHMSLKKAGTYLLVMHYAPTAEAAVNQVLRAVRHQQLKSKTNNRAGVEMTLEIRFERQDLLLNKLLSLDGVQDATLVAYQNESL